MRALSERVRALTAELEAVSRHRDELLEAQRVTEGARGDAKQDIPSAAPNPKPSNPLPHILSHSLPLLRIPHPPTPPSSQQALICLTPLLISGARHISAHALQAVLHRSGLNTAGLSIGLTNNFISSLSFDSPNSYHNFVTKYNHLNDTHNLIFLFRLHSYPTINRTTFIIRSKTTQTPETIAKQISNIPISTHLHKNINDPNKLLANSHLDIQLHQTDNHLTLTTTPVIANAIQLILHIAKQNKIETSSFLNFSIHYPPISPIPTSSHPLHQPQSSPLPHTHKYSQSLFNKTNAI